MHRRLCVCVCVCVVDARGCRLLCMRVPVCVRACVRACVSVRKEQCVYYDVIYTQ